MPSDRGRDRVLDSVVDWGELSWPAGLLLAAALVYSIARGIHIHIHRYDGDQKSEKDSE